MFLGLWVPGPKLANYSALSRVYCGGFPKDQDGASTGCFGLCFPGDGTPLCLSALASGPPRIDLAMPDLGSSG